ncbi:MAG: aldo/keto reductase [Tenericutes bacterium]|nr:aldo/keto reductase [Mycoplasmatota bacterium]
MNKRILGKRNPGEVSILGFGCMRFQTIDNDYGRINEAVSMEQIRYAIDHGLNYLDTAWPYHNETSEGFVAKVLEDGYREKVYIADKLPSWLIKTREDMDKFLDEQLKRLNVEYIDYYLLHALNKNSWANLVENNVFDFIEKALASGKIKNIGFSFHDSYEAFEEIILAFDWDFCQIQFNFYDLEYQAGLKGLKLAASKDIGVIVMEPLRGGRLANNVPDEIKEIYKSSGHVHSPAGWALRYVWNYPEVKLVLSGMNELEHIKDNLEEASNTLANSLTDVEELTIQKVNVFYKARIQVDCTDCKYCMPCPFGINIPQNFAMYNSAHVFDAYDRYKGLYYSQLKPEQMADMCQQCGECISKCPQNIQIIDELVNVAEYFKK